MDDTVDLRTLSDLATPWSVRVVATLRIADHLAAGTTDLAALAAAAGCDAAALYQILGHLVSRGVFREPEPGCFALTDFGAGLLEPGLRLGLDLDDIGGRFAHAWGTLLTYVRTGEAAYHTVFGRPFWEDLAAHPTLAASFDELMGPAGHGPPDIPPLTGGWEHVRQVVDVGGGTGALLAAILRAHPTMEGTLVDLPGTVARSDVTFALAGVAARVTTVGQSFFDPLPAGADVYVLHKVLNDWPARDVTAILRRCADAARPNGRVVVDHGIAPDDAPRSISEETVVVGGTTQPLATFRELARAAGLDVVAAVRQPSGRFVVECRPSG